MRQANQGTPRQEQNPTKAIVRYVNESDACDDHTPAPVRVALIPAYEPGEHMLKRHSWAIAFSACLLGFTAYLALDTFVLARPYMEGATQMNTSMFANNPSASAGDVGSGTVGDTSGDAVEDDSASSGSSADESATSEHSASRKPSGKYERRSESSSSGGSDASTTGPLR